MFWADRVAKEIQEARADDIACGKKLVIRDEKTLSGRVHIGSMRGLAIHGLVAEVLAERGVENEFFWEHNDFDVFDSVPGYLDQANYREHVGKLLYAVPSPEPGFENYAEYFRAEFEAVHRKIGISPTYYRATELYRSGRMDECIRIALTRAADIRRILKEVSGSVKDDTWLPASVVCENCGKIMTTRAFGFDGETVGYACDRNPDEAKSCGHAGRVAPWKGAAKLFWKTEWAAKWKVMGVDIEGAGKDHSTKGGARDVANHIAKEVFDIGSPFDVPYEFFLVGGKKMSSSKGKGSSAKEMGELFPPSLLRLVLMGKDINQQIEVEPSGDSVPRMYDWYDELAELVRNGVADDFTRLYQLVQLPEDQAEERAPWQLRFSQVAFMVQMPHLSLQEEAERVKGSLLTQEEEELLEERAGYARFWLKTYAPDAYRYELQKSLPNVELSDTQKDALRRLYNFIKEEARTGEDIQNYLFELKEAVPIKPAELFSAIYQVFLARTSGPKAGWFLSVLPRDMVLKRLMEAVV